MTIQKLGNYQSTDTRKRLENHIGNLNKVQQLQAQKYLDQKMKASLYSNRDDLFQKNTNIV